MQVCFPSATKHVVLPINHYVNRYLSRITYFLIYVFSILFSDFILQIMKEHLRFLKSLSYTTVCIVFFKDDIAYFEWG